MKPFNLEAAKKGAPVCTREGKPVRILCFDRIGDTYPIIGLINHGDIEICTSWLPSGRVYVDDESPRDNDLMMVDPDTDDDSCVSDDFVERLAQRIIEKMDEQRKNNIT